MNRDDHTPADTESAILGGGCFWCLEAAFADLRGVQRVESGYAGGHVARPTYQQVCAGTTGHAEVVRVDFDPRIITFGDLLDVSRITRGKIGLRTQRVDLATVIRNAASEPARSSVGTVRAAAIETST